MKDNRNYLIVSVTAGQKSCIEKLDGFTGFTNPHRAIIMATHEVVDAFLARFTTELSSTELQHRVAEALGDNYYSRFNRVIGALSGGGTPLYLPKVDEP